MSKDKCKCRNHDEVMDLYMTIYHEILNIAEKYKEKVGPLQFTYILMDLGIDVAMDSTPNKHYGGYRLLDIFSRIVMQKWDEIEKTKEDEDEDEEQEEGTE